MTDADFYVWWESLRPGVQGRLDRDSAHDGWRGARAFDVTPRPQWIPPTIKPPENELVVFLINGRRPTIGYYRFLQNRDRWFDESGREWGDTAVTGWFLLPERHQSLTRSLDEIRDRE